VPAKKSQGLPVLQRANHEKTYPSGIPAKNEEDSI